MASDPSDNSDWDDYEAEEGAEELGTFQSLFSEAEFPSFEALRRHDAEAFGLDLRAVAADLQLDFFGVMRLVNLVRRKAAEDVDPAVVRREVYGAWEARLKDPEEEELLKPFLAEDALLWSVEAILNVTDEEMEGVFELGPENGPEAPRGEAATEKEALEAQVAELQRRLEAAATVVRELTGTGEEADGSAEAAAETKEGRPGKPDHDTYYSDSYSYLGIHETMLRDAPRTGTYHAALTQNEGRLVRGKTVLDVGCGTGVLSMFAAKAGAAQVVGVDFSDMAATARLLVEDNGCDGIVTIVHGKMEDAVLPVGDHEVDVIVSEWMGYALFYENMLASVLDARDRYLRPGGTLVPDSATMVLAGLQDPAFLAFWDDVYGLDFSRIRSQVLIEPEVELVDAELVLTTPATLKHFNLNAMTIDEVDFHSDFELEAPPDAQVSVVNAFVVWFDCGFGGRGEPATEIEVTLKTGPRDPATHWKQTVLRLPPSESIPVPPGGVVRGRYSMARSEGNSREVDITVEWTCDQSEGGKKVQGSRVYHMGR